MTDRYNSLDFLKFFANIGILLHHYQQVTYYSFNYYLDAFYGYFYWGYLVELFFAISGFFAIRYVKRISDGCSLGKYFLHKLMRFVPALALCDLVYVIVVMCYHRVIPLEQQLGWSFFNAQTDLWKYITSVLCINYGGAIDADNSTTINGVTWTICVLMICYVWLFLFVYIAKKTKTNPVIFYLIMILTGVAITEYSIHLPFFNSYTARGYCAFFAGLLLAEYVRKRKGYHHRLWIRIVLFAGSFFLMLFTKSVNQEYLCGIIVWPLLVSIFTDPSAERLFRGGKAWHFLGNMGFEIYIWHPVVICLMLMAEYVFNVEMKDYGVWAVLLFMIICFLIGMIAYFVEKQLRKHVPLFHTQI